VAEGKLTGQVAIVTGASSGIGKATAYALADVGAKVAIVARSADIINQMADEITGKGGAAIAYAADVADADAVERFVTNVVHEWGRIDLLFANAGVNTKQRNLHDMSVAQWDHVIDVNLNGVLYCVRAVLPQMRTQHQGTIITLASMAGRRSGVMSGVAYGASKAGAVSISHSTNAEEKINGIRATAILPGEVATAILDHRPNPPSAEARATMLQPEDVAETVVFVAGMPHRVTIDELWITPTVQRERIPGEDAPKKEP
jgi:NADP-dependent 3-hydroxy acid dehydrogenase YdfG